MFGVNMKKRYLILIGLLSMANAHAAQNVLLKKQISIAGTVVASSCSVSIETGTSRVGFLDFGEYNQSSRSGGITKPFVVKLFENGATSPGCSAFYAGGEFVSIEFGDKGNQQLDERGVITKGAGDNIRIAITSTDTGKVSNQDAITSKNSILKYPRDFAVKGQFGFNAHANGLDVAKAGRYSGSLSLVVSYK